LPSALPVDICCKKVKSHRYGIANHWNCEKAAAKDVAFGGWTQPFKNLLNDGAASDEAQ
jgi:hypothetical protein